MFSGFSVSMKSLNCLGDSFSLYSYKPCFSFSKFWISLIFLEAGDDSLCSSSMVYNLLYKKFKILILLINFKEIIKVLFSWLNRSDIIFFWRTFVIFISIFIFRGRTTRYWYIIVLFFLFRLLWYLVYFFLLFFFFFVYRYLFLILSTFKLLTKLFFIVLYASWFRFIYLFIKNRERTRSSFIFRNSFFE